MLQRYNWKLCGNSCCKQTSFYLCLCSNGSKPWVSLGLFNVELSLGYKKKKSFISELSIVCSAAVILTLLLLFGVFWFVFGGFLLLLAMRL